MEKMTAGVSLLLAGVHLARMMVTDNHTVCCSWLLVFLIADVLEIFFFAMVVAFWFERLYTVSVIVRKHYSSTSLIDAFFFIVLRDSFVRATTLLSRRNQTDNGSCFAPPLYDGVRGDGPAPSE
jgi:hypothetical protein